MDPASFLSINLNFENTNLRPLSTPEDYINALPRGSKNGGVSAIVDEIPYLNIFLAKYSRDYFMVGRTITTNGFGFVFRKGSPLVPELSRAIAKLREDKKLAMMENAWFNSPSTLTSDEYSNNVKPLTFGRFSGLFLITGISSASALAIFSSFMLYKNWHYLRNCILSCDLNWVRIQILKGYLFRVFTNVLGRRQPNNVIIHPVPVL